jgi:hypothetical protein
MFGGFSSLFVYLSGSTQLASAFHQTHLVMLLTSPEAKVVKMVIALVGTLYFGFSFLHSYKKSYARNMEMEKKKEVIVKQEAALTLIDERLFKLRKVREDAEKIQQMLRIAEAQVSVKS